MKIKRTDFANMTRRAAVTIYDPWGGDGSVFADTVFEDDCPTHSPILGPDGLPLEYEPRQPIGFDLRRK